MPSRAAGLGGNGSGRPSASVICGDESHLEMIVLLRETAVGTSLTGVPTLDRVPLEDTGGSVGFGPERAAWIGEAIRAGDTAGASDTDIESASRILSTLFLGAMVGVAAGREPDDVVGVLDEATRRLLP